MHVRSPDVGFSTNPLPLWILRRDPAGTYRMCENLTFRQSFNS
jgi:hypothetical protein